MKTKNYNLILLLIFLSSSVFSQVKEREIISKTKEGIPKVIRFKETKVSSDKKTVTSFLKEQFKTEPNTEFKSSKIEGKARNGFLSQKYNQYYKGIKVEFARINTISKNGSLHQVNGSYIDVKDLSINPNINKNTAIKYAKKHIGAEKYMWENDENEKFIKQLKKNNKATYFPKGELVVIRENILDESSKPILAYKINIYAELPFSKYNVYVNANNGKIIYKSSLLSHVEGTAQTRYSGTRTIETEQVGSQFRLRDYSRGNGIETYNMNNSSNYSNVTDFIDNDNNWTSAEYDNTNRDNAALDLHWGTEMTYDYFSQTHNFNSLNGQGILIRAYANWGNLNAQWDSSEEVIRFGNGNTTSFDALTSLDVIAHEYGHGIDHFSSQLEYINESGALDEGIADVWGSMVELFAAPEKDTYLLGEDITLNQTALRSMSNPKAFGNPDTYQGDNWQTGSGDFGGVHTNSGVLGHWFYLLAQGSSTTDGINDNNDSFSFNGIGTNKAADILFHAQQNYFTDPLMDYLGARQLTIQAAEDLYGIGSIEASTTCQSWFAVGVGNNNCNINIEIAGSKNICGNSTRTYTLNYIPNSISWSTSNNLQILSSNANSVTIKPISTSTNGTATINVTADGVSETKTIWIGKPDFYVQVLNNGNYIDFKNIFLKNNIVALSEQGVYSVIWQKISGSGNIYASTSYEYQAEAYGPNGLDLYAKVTVTNTCGSNIKYFDVEYSPQENPCEDITFNGNTISTPNCDQPTFSSTSNSLSSTIKNIAIYNLNGQKIISVSNVNNLDVRNLSTGIYIVKMEMNNGKILTKKIIK